MKAYPQSFQSSSTTFKIGKYTFEYPSSHPKKKPIHKQAIRVIKKQHFDTLDISWGKYKRHRWDILLKRVKDCEIERINAYNNSDKQIIKALNKISFFNLSYLDIGECQIESIEHLPEGPNLNYLSLINNHITSVKSLKKFHFPALKTLLLNENPIKQINVERCDFTLETYWLERKYNFKTVKQCLSQTCLFKLKTEQMKDLSIESIGRIHQANLIKKLHEKYTHLQKLFYIDPEDMFESDTQFVVFMQDAEEIQDENEIQIPQFPIIEDNIEEIPSLQHVKGQSEENWTLDNQQTQSTLITENEGKSQSIFRQFRQEKIYVRVKELNSKKEKIPRKKEQILPVVGNTSSENYSDSDDIDSDQMEESESYFSSSGKCSSCWDSDFEVEFQQGQIEQKTNQQKTEDLTNQLLPENQQKTASSLLEDEN